MFDIPRNEQEYREDITTVHNNLIYEKAEQFKIIKDFRTAYPSLYQLAFQRGILQKVVSHMSPYRKWTCETLRAEALKYKTRTEFADRNSSAYQSAIRLGILGGVCQHMPRGYKKWTSEEVIAFAQSCLSFKSFRRNKPAYNAACRLGILKSIYFMLKEPHEPGGTDVELEHHMKRHGIKSKVKIK